MGWNANSLSARMLHLLHQFVPDLYSVTLFLPTSSNTAYSLSGIGRFDKILPYPHEDEQELMIIAINFQFKQSFLSTFFGSDTPRSLRYISSSRQCFIDPPELLFTTLFLTAFSLPLYIFRRSRSVTTTVNKSQRRQAFACRLF